MALRSNFSASRKSLGSGDFEAHFLFRARMDERKFPRMQHHARSGAAGQFRELLVLLRAVNFITRERMAEELEMHANLVRPAGVDLRLDKRRGLQLFQHAPACVRRAAGIVVAHGHAFAMRRMPRDGRADFAGAARQFAADNRVVDFFHAALGKLFREREVRPVIFGDDEAAAGFLVEPVDDAGPRHAADAAQRAFAMVQQRVDERVFLVAGGGMHDESGGLVQHEQRLVLEQNVQRHFLRLRLGGPGVRPVDFNFLAGARRVRGFGGLAVDADVALLDEPLQRAARGGGEFCPQKNVQPLARQRFLDGEFFGAVCHPQIALIFTDEVYDLFLI